jgi:hypothetical protein
MSISGISGSASPSAPSSAQLKADETVQQLAQQGDPVAIAKLKQEEKEQDPAATATTPASEPGKGEQIDRYL